MALGEARDILILEPAPRGASDKEMLSQLASISNVQRINATLSRQHRNVLAALALLGPDTTPLTTLDMTAAALYTPAQIQAIADKLDQLIAAYNVSNQLLSIIQQVAEQQIVRLGQQE